MTLIEMLTATLAVSVIMAGLLQAFVSMWQAQTFATRMPQVQQDARQMALTLAGALRRATLCTSADSASGCTIDAAVENTSGSGVTVYKRVSGTLTKLTYAISGANFQLTSGGTTNTLYSDAAVGLTYYSSNSYRATNFTAYVPDSTTTKNLVSVGIQTSVTRNGITGTYFTLVRLRNSPKKLSASE